MNSNVLPPKHLMSAETSFASRVVVDHKNNMNSRVQKLICFKQISKQLHLLVLWQQQRKMRRKKIYSIFITFSMPNICGNSTQYYK